ncbi:MAG TPA: DUF3576 domain-containing protein [Rhodospirillaceae bacterium]|nr:DUF3576 domain-containing protein [Rhodospirillaceae bacterium]
MKRISTVLVMIAAMVVGACSGGEEGPKTTEAQPLQASGAQSSKNGGLLEAVFGTGDSGDAGGSTVAVNGYLWRASLDTISFLPLNTADPFGGVIITEWYSPPEAPNERFKVNIYILDKALRADGLRVTVFRQKRAGSNRWVEAKVNQKTGTDLENAILKRARQMRIRLGQ